MRKGKLRMSKKNIIITIIAIIVIITLSILVINLISNSNKDMGKNANNQTTNQVATKKSNYIFEIYNTDIKTNTGSTRFTATVKNISKNKIEKQRIEIILMDKEENEIGTIFTTIPSLESKETAEISAEDLKVYENIYDFKIK